jgi:hypothetical protein
VTEKDSSSTSLVELYTNLTEEQLGRLAPPQRAPAFLPLDEERTCRKEICRRRYVSKQVAVEYGPTARRDCESAKEILHAILHGIKILNKF